jgi:hypothetical protein
VDEAVAAVRIDQEFSGAQCIIYELLNHLPVRHTTALDLVHVVIHETDSGGESPA